MTEVAEGFFISLSHEGHSKETCAFCTKPPEPTDQENDLEAKENMDAKELSGIRSKGIAFKNCADKLGKALCSIGEDQLFGEIKLKGMGNRLPVHTAAHHLIPGNASLKPSEIMAYLHVDKTANGNIGYSINNHENGSWLVGNYALRGENGLPSWGELGTEFTNDTNKDPKEYAFAAIEKLKRQFHDAHSDYNKFVLNELDLLAKKLQKKEDLWCPLDKKKKKMDPKKLQLFMLVARLNTISRRLKKFVENPSKKWRENLVTSRFSLDYIKERIL